MKKYYYDVVVSICTETERVGSDLICGGFKTEDEAMKCIEDGKFSLIPYYNRCKDNEIACIEIEKREDETENLIDIITVD